MHRVADFNRSNVIGVTEARQSMLKKGFFVFQEVLSQDEITRLRSATRQHFKATGRPDPLGGLRQANIAVEMPAIAWVCHHPRVLSCLREAFGTDRIMFTSDATAYKDVLIGWHKDDTEYFKEPKYRAYECAVYKVSIYLHDHHRDGNGLWIREGSHKFHDDVGPIRDTAIRTGSIVIFDVRTTHRGLAKSKFQRLILRLSSYLPQKLQPYAAAGFAKTRMLYRAMMGRERILLTISFGHPNDFTIEYAKRSMRRQMNDTPGTSPMLPSRLRSEFEANGVLLAEDYFSELQENP